jgi:hypothetical protein
MSKGPNKKNLEKLKVALEKIKQKNDVKPGNSKTAGNGGKP